MIVGRLRSFEHESNGTLKYFLDRFTALCLLSVVSITHKRHKFKQMDAGCAWEVHYRILITRNHLDLGAQMVGETAQMGPV